MAIPAGSSPRGTAGWRSKHDHPEQVIWSHRRSGDFAFIARVPYAGPAALTGRWFGIRFFVRSWLTTHSWLLTPLGPFVNIASGLTGYSWPRFLLYDLLGEALWVALYVLLGNFFSDRVEELSDTLGDFTWAAVSLLLAALLARLFGFL